MVIQVITPLPFFRGFFKNGALFLGSCIYFIFILFLFIFIFLLFLQLGPKTLKKKNSNNPEKF